MKIMMFLHSGSLNRGCEAIVRSGCKIINDNIKNSKFYLSSFRPETDKELDFIEEIYDAQNLEIQRYSIDWLISGINVKLFKNEDFAHKKIHKNIIDKVSDKDIILSIGGDAYCYGEQPGWYVIDKEIKKMGKKLVLWGASIGQEDITEAKLKDLKSFDLILARESITYEMLKQNGLKNVKLCADGAFVMDKEELPLPEGWLEGNTIGLNFSPLVLNRNKGSQESIEALIKHILETTDMTIALTPHVTEDGNNDYEILNKYYQSFKDSKRVIILPDNLNCLQYKGYISRMRFFIGARTHATIAAYSSNIPTMVLGYSVKSKGISKDIFGDENFVIDIKDISNSDIIIEKFDEMIKNEDYLINTLKNSIPKIQEKSYEAGRILKELIEN